MSISRLTADEAGGADHGTGIAPSHCGHMKPVPGAALSPGEATKHSALRATSAPFRVGIGFPGGSGGACGMPPKKGPRHECQ